MTPLPTKEEIAEAERECSKAYKESKFVSPCPDVYRLRHKAFPYAYEPDIEDQHLRVAIDRSGSFVLLDLGGFLTFVDSTPELSTILQQERDNPGGLREMITGRNNIKEMKIWRGKKRKELSRDYATNAKHRTPEINLDDLELKI